jgi:hypothetical protein
VPSRSSWARCREYAELVAVGVGEHDPADVTPTDVGPRRTQHEEPADLILMVGAAVSVLLTGRMTTRSRSIDDAWLR